MSSTRSNRVALWGGVAALVISIVTNVGGGVLELFRGSPNGVPPPALSDVQYILNGVLSGVAAALIAWRRPDNVLWRILAVTGVAGGVFGLTTEYTMHSHLTAPSTGFFPDAAAWLSSWMFAFIPATAALTLLLFPTGRPLGPRWRWLTWTVLVAFALSCVSQAFHPGWVQNRPIGAPGPIHNPLAIALLAAPLDAVGLVANALFGVSFAGAIVTLVLRYRRGSVEERQQIKILMYVAAFAPFGFVLYPLYSTAGPPTLVSVGTLIIGSVGAVGFPVAILVAILKYGLYDIDVVISRTLVYGALAAFITLVYVGIVVGVGTLIGQGGRPNLALSIIATALVAVGFQPLRERLQRAANRLVYGRRATPYEVLSELSSRVADAVDADEVLPRMARVLRDGTAAEYATVWLRDGRELRPAATAPESVVGYEPVALSDGTLPRFPDDARAAAVEHQGELLGALTVAKRPGETLTPIEQLLLQDLARQAGLLLKNVGLASALEARLGELRESRKRLVAAQDEERRRLERNLHDGAQQHLVAMKVKLGLAGAMTERDPEKAAQLIEQLESDAGDALETLRDLARGIYPPLLAGSGLKAALEAQAGRATLPVTIQAENLGRYPQDVEAAVYFCVLEALQNVQKYAEASSATVTIDEHEGSLHFSVVDDGRGFDPAAAHGSGLTNMRDRIDALGGRLQVVSAPGQGTRVTGRVALPVTVGANS